MNFEIRLANEREAEALSDLAARSKAHWPYDDEYLRLSRAAIRVTPDDLRKWPFLVAVDGDSLLGFAGICEIKGEPQLDHLWIDPRFIGKGLGRALFTKSIAKARDLGWSSFVIVADPYAEDFYRKMGARRIGERESKVRKGFMLPLLEFNFSAHAKREGP